MSKQIKCNQVTTQSEEVLLKSMVFDRLIAHLDSRKDVQNIDLMIVSGFCRNCLSKWYQQAAAQMHLDIETDQAREKIYGMPYAEWKEKHQLPATDEQLKALNQS